MKMKNRSHRYKINRPSRPTHVYKCTKRDHQQIIFMFKGYCPLTKPLPLFLTGQNWAG